MKCKKSALPTLLKLTEIWYLLLSLAKMHWNHCSLFREKKQINLVCCFTNLFGFIFKWDATNRYEKTGEFLIVFCIIKFCVMPIGNPNTQHCYRKLLGFVF